MIIYLFSNMESINPTEKVITVINQIDILSNMLTREPHISLIIADDMIEHIIALTNLPGGYSELQKKRPNLDLILYNMGVMIMVLDSNKAIELLNIILNQYIKEKKPDKAMKIFREIIEEWLETGEIETIIKIYHWSINFYNQTSNVHKKIDMMRFLIPFHDIKGEYEKADEIFRTALVDSEKSPNKYDKKMVKKEYEGFKKKIEIWKKAREWQKKLDLRDVIIYSNLLVLKDIIIYSVNDDKWRALPLDPKKKKLKELSHETWYLYTPKTSKLRFYFEGIDVNGQKVKNDNDGQYFKL